MALIFDIVCQSYTDHKTFFLFVHGLRSIHKEWFCDLADSQLQADQVMGRNSPDLSKWEEQRLVYGLSSNNYLDSAGASARKWRITQPNIRGFTVCMCVNIFKHIIYTYIDLHLCYPPVTGSCYASSVINRSLRAINSHFSRTCYFVFLKSYFK